MFEINLVPDIKADMLRKQRLANLILFICIIVAAAAAGVVLILGGIVGGQNIALANQDTEIECRSGSDTGKTKCDSSHGTGVLKFANVNEFLTIQDQMSRLKTLNENKKLLSRVFGILDVLLPTGDETVSISELSIDLTAGSLTFEAQGNSVSNIDYKALEVFKKSASKSYYDYGNYYRTDESGSPVAIPTYCITETFVGGIPYGVYTKGAKGCEAPLTTEAAPEEAETTEDPAAETGDPSTETENPTTETETSDTEATPTTEIVNVPIRRTYATQAEKDAYKTSNPDNDGGYYFESKCMNYDETGKFDENATLAVCPLLVSEITIRDSSNGRDSNENLVLRFSANVMITPAVFQFKSKHMRIVGPSRQNVTDSYTQIRDMFTERPVDCDPNDPACTEENVNGN